MKPMRLLFLYLIVTFMVVTACSTTSNIKDNQCTDYIKLEKSGCLLDCKAYQLTLCKDLTAFYKGLHRVEKRGHYIRTITPQEYANLWELADSLKIYSLASSYGPFGEDSQSCMLTLSKNGKKKTIRYGARVPFQISPFLDLLESIGENGKWKPIKQ